MPRPIEIPLAFGFAQREPLRQPPRRSCDGHEARCSQRDKMAAEAPYRFRRPCHPGEGLIFLNAIARLDGHAQKSTRYGRTDNIHLAHARSTLIEKTCADRAAIDGRDFDGDGLRHQREHREQNQNDDTEGINPAMADHVDELFHTYSRDLSTATRSSRSTSRRTQSAATTTAAMTMSAERA